MDKFIKDEELEWMPMVVHEGKVFLRVDGIYDFIDKVEKGAAPKREKEVLQKFKRVVKQFEKLAFEANSRKGAKTYDA